MLRLPTPFGAQYSSCPKRQHGASTYPFMRAAGCCSPKPRQHHNNDVATAMSRLNELNSSALRIQLHETGDALFREIMVTRRIELWGEGQNFTAFKRWNLPVRNAWVAGDAQQRQLGK